MASARLEIEIQWPAWWLAWQQLMEQMPPWWGICLISPQRIVYQWRLIGSQQWREGTIILTLVPYRERGDE